MQSSDVCEHYGMMESDLAEKRRMRKPAELRAVTGWLATELNSATLSEVANRFGRDIATLSGAVRRVRERAQEESEYREGLNKLENKALRTRAKKETGHGAGI